MQIIPNIKIEQGIHFSPGTNIFPELEQLGHLLLKPVRICLLRAAVRVFSSQICNSPYDVN